MLNAIFKLKATHRIVLLQVNTIQALHYNNIHIVTSNISMYNVMPPIIVICGSYGFSSNVCTMHWY